MSKVISMVRALIKERDADEVGILLLNAFNIALACYALWFVVFR